VLVRAGLSKRRAFGLIWWSIFAWPVLLYIACDVFSRDENGTDIFFDRIRDRIRLGEF
jgi:hypothetical protein